MLIGLELHFQYLFRGAPRVRKTFPALRQRSSGIATTPAADGGTSRSLRLARRAAVPRQLQPMCDFVPRASGSRPKAMKDYLEIDKNRMKCIGRGADLQKGSGGISGTAGATWTGHYRRRKTCAVNT